MNVVLHPTNQLAIARTILANERTLLSYLRGSLGCLIGGVGLIKFLNHPVFLLGGSALVIISVILFGAGLRRFHSVKKLISEIDPADWLAVEGRIAGAADKRGPVSERAPKNGEAHH